MRKKLLTVALAATMVVSSVFNAFAAETVVGKAWWNAENEKSSPITIADGETVTFKIDVAEATEAETTAEGTVDTYAAFCVEVTDGTNYFTTTSAGDAWGNGNPEKDMSADAKKGGSYTVTMTRTGNDFVAKYVDNATGSAMFGDLKLTGDVDFADTTVYVMGQVGTLTVEKVEAGSNSGSENSTQAPSNNDETTTAAPSESKGEVTPSKTGDTSAVAVVAIVALGAAVAVLASKKKVTE